MCKILDMIVNGTVQAHLMLGDVYATDVFLLASRIRCAILRQHQVADVMFASDPVGVRCHPASFAPAPTCTQESDGISPIRSYIVGHVCLGRMFCVLLHSRTM